MITIANKWDGSPGDVAPAYVDLTISADEGDLIIEINAPFHNNRRPSKSGRCPNLWEYEVVELFIATTQAPNFSSAPYLEFIVGPHGNWLIIGFTGEGKWDECDDTITLEQEPVVTIDPVTNRWNATISFPCSHMPEPECDPMLPLSLKWLFNAFAMFGDDPASRVCMACHPVPGDAPNFHQLKYFKPMILFETDPNRHPSADIRQGPYPVVGPAQLNASLFAAHLKSSVAFNLEATEITSPQQVPVGARVHRKSILEVAEMHRAPMPTPPSPPDASSAATATATATVDASPPSSAAADSSLVSGATSATDDTLLIDKYLRHLHEGEFVVLIGKVLKRKVSSLLIMQCISLLVGCCMFIRVLYVFRVPGMVLQAKNFDTFE